MPVIEKIMADSKFVNSRELPGTAGIASKRARFHNYVRAKVWGQWLEKTSLAQSTAGAERQAPQWFRDTFILAPA